MRRRSHFNPALTTVQPPPLLYADSSTSPDQRYFGRIQVPDPFISFLAGRRKVCVVSAMELRRAKRDSSFDVVLPLEAWHQKARQRWPDRRIGPAEVILLLAEHYRIRAFTVPGDFPAGVAFKLVHEGLMLVPAPGMIFPEREIKSPAEISALRAGNRCAACGIAAAEDLLRRARVNGRWLYPPGPEADLGRPQIRHRNRVPWRRRRLARHDRRRRKPGLRSARKRARPAPRA